MLGDGRSTKKLRPAYPVLAQCLAHGRQASAKEVERLAARILRELTPRHGPQPRQMSRRAVEAALAAIEGQACLRCRAHPAPAGRGH